MTWEARVGPQKTSAWPPSLTPPSTGVFTPTSSRATVPPIPPAEPAKDDEGFNLLPRLESWTASVSRTSASDGAERSGADVRPLGEGPERVRGVPAPFALVEEDIPGGFRAMGVELKLQTEVIRGIHEAPHIGGPWYESQLSLFRYLFPLYLQP